MLSRFVAAIPVNGTPVQFEFHTMNVKQLQLFQVYVMHEGKKARFHVQIDENSEFKITDEESCPAPYRDMSKAFSDAIYAFYAQG